MAWAHMLKQGGGGLSNPFEFREVIQAAFKYDEERTVDQVVADQEKRRKEREKPTNSGVPMPSQAVLNVEMEKLKAMQKAGSQAKPPASE